MRGLVSIVLVAVTVVVQLTVVDRLAFPGGADPDLVLLVVAALALAGGPLAGVLTGFLAGLALDVAPPGSHLVGQDALVFCLIGYACGLLADDSSGDAEQGHTALFEIMATAAGAICGEGLMALLGVMLSDPRVSWPAITRVLPVAVAYDVLLCPFVLYAAAAALRLAGGRGQVRRPGWSAGPVRTAVSGVGPGSIGGLRKGVLGGSQLRGSQLRGSQFRASQFRGGSPGTAAWSGSAGLGGARFGSSSMGRSLFGSSVFSRSSALGLGSPLGRTAGGLAWHVPRFSRGSSLARLTGALRRSAGPKSPGRGWLRGASSRGRSSLGRSSLGGGSLSGSSLGSRAFGRRRFGRRRFGRGRFGRGPASWSGAGPSRLRMPRPRTKRRWRTGGYR